MIGRALKIEAKSGSEFPFRRPLISTLKMGIQEINRTTAEMTVAKTN